MKAYIIYLGLLTSICSFAGGTQGGGVGAQSLSLTSSTIRSGGTSASTKEPRAQAAPREKGIAK